MIPVLDVEFNGADLWVLDHIRLSVVGVDGSCDLEAVLCREAREDLEVVLLPCVHDFEVVQRN